MIADLTDPLWGTGYGSKRHLVDGEPVEHVAKGWRMARSRCGQLLRRFADSDRRIDGDPKTEAERVASRPPCARCQKIADREAQS